MFVFLDSPSPYQSTTIFLGFENKDTTSSSSVWTCCANEPVDDDCICRDQIWQLHWPVGIPLLVVPPLLFVLNLLWFSKIARGAAKLFLGQGKVKRSPHCFPILSCEQARNRFKAYLMMLVGLLYIFCEFSMRWQKWAPKQLSWEYAIQAASHNGGSWTSPMKLKELVPFK